jgi:hypothetical protein
MYLDTGRLQDYLSSLDPGIIEEFTETSRSQSNKEGRAGIRAAVMGAGVDAGAGGQSEEETTRERTVRVRAQNLFSRVYDELDKNDSIKVFDEDTSLALDDFGMFESWPKEHGGPIARESTEVKVQPSSLLPSRFTKRREPSELIQRTNRGRVATRRA